VSYTQRAAYYYFHNYSLWGDLTDGVEFLKRHEGEVASSPRSEQVWNPSILHTKRSPTEHTMKAESPFSVSYPNKLNETYQHFSNTLCINPRKFLK